MVEQALKGDSPMELTPDQQDALIELLNIGFGRAAASLSELTGHRVVLEVPQVSVHPIAELNQSLRPSLDDEVAQRPPDLLRSGRAATRC